MNAKELSEMIYSPSWVGTILSFFISGAQQVDSRGVKLELIYLVIPLLNNTTILDKLAQAKITSNFESVFNGKFEKVSLVGITQQISIFKDYSNKGLIALASTKNMDVSDVIKIEETLHYKNETNISLKKIYKASFNLGVIVAKEEPSDVLIRIGLK